MATPYGSARPRRRGSVIVPLTLIFIGGVFLLQNAGILSPSVWGSLWRLWPLLLVVIGLELLFGSRAGWLVAIVGLAATLFALAFLSGWTFSTTSPAQAGVAPRTFRTDLNGATQASVTVRFGAGQLDVTPLADAGTGQLAFMSFDGPSDLAVEPAYTVVGNTGRLEYQLSGKSAQGFLPNGQRNAAPRVAINLSPSVQISSFVVQTGATNTNIDLTGLKINNVDMAIGAAAAHVRLPDSGVTSVHVSGGASTITLEVPPGVAARIRHRGGLSTISVDQSRFPSVGDDVYQSSDWESAQNKVDVNLETGVATIQVS